MDEAGWQRRTGAPVLTQGLINGEVTITDNITLLGHWPGSKGRCKRRLLSSMALYFQEGEPKHDGGASAVTALLFWKFNVILGRYERTLYFCLTRLTHHILRTQTLPCNPIALLSIDPNI